MHRLILPLFVVTLARAHKHGNLDAALILEIFGSDYRKSFDEITEVVRQHGVTEKPAVPDALELNKDEETKTSASCITDNGEAGECVQYYLCDDNSTIITDGVGIIDLRIRKGPCDSYLESCCVPSNRRQPDRPIIPNSDERLEQLKDAGCGWRNPEGVGFRIEGDDDSEAEFGEFPWMVAVLRVRPVYAYDLEGPKKHAYLGGGSLIHQSVVLTAAHYLGNVTSLVARVGEWDTQTTNEIYPHQDRNVAEIEIHEDFNPGNLFYDIALLFLESPVDLAPNVGLVCLPRPDDRPPLDGRCFASGWGKNKFGKEGSYQVIMKKVNLPVVDHNRCQAQLRRTRLGRFFTLHSSFMCAGGEPGKDTCKGDGGSPLVCPIEDQPDRYRQYGIVAWGIRCGEGGTPGVYADVAALGAWVDAAVLGRGYDPNVYTA